MVMVSTADESIPQIQKTSNERPNGSQVRMQTSRLQGTLDVIERVTVS